MNIKNSIWVKRKKWCSKGQFYLVFQNLFKHTYIYILQLILKVYVVICGYLQWDNTHEKSDIDVPARIRDEHE